MIVRSIPDGMKGWVSMIQFDAEMKVPADFAVGIQTMRPGLIRRVDRALSREEGHAVADAMATLLSSLITQTERADSLEGRLHEVGRELARLKKSLQSLALELGEAVKMTVVPEPLPGDDEPGGGVTELAGGVVTQAGVFDRTIKG
jgi:hypothetical protein